MSKKSLKSRRNKKLTPAQIAEVSLARLIPMLAEEANVAIVAQVLKHPLANVVEWGSAVPFALGVRRVSPPEMISTHPWLFQDWPIIAAVANHVYAPRTEEGPWFVVLHRGAGGRDTEASIPVQGGEVVVHRVTQADVARVQALGSTSRVAAEA